MGGSEAGVGSFSFVPAISYQPFLFVRLKDQPFPSLYFRLGCRRGKLFLFEYPDFRTKDDLHKRLFDLPVSSEWLFVCDSKRVADAPVRSSGTT